MRLTFGSLFAGIGGLDLGLERVGLTCKYQVEIDDYATRVLQKHWPDVPRFRDVRSVGAHNLPAVDLICGSFPCQGISDAGKRAGFDDPRSGLWAEFARIIRELRPRYVLVENVAALLHRGLGRVLGDLAALRYDAEWECIPAAAVGAPHIRDRVFILAYTDSAERGQIAKGDFPNGHDSGRQKTPGGFATRSTDGRAPNVADSDSHEQHGRRGTLQVGWFGGAQALAAARERSGVEWSAEPGMGRVANGVPNRVDRLRGLGLAVVPQVAEYIGRCIIAMEEAV